MPNDAPASERRPHLLLALSPHGYGHAAMTAPVINAVRRILPELRLTIQTAVPGQWLSTRYEGAFELIPRIPDFGLRQTSATSVMMEETAREYAALHSRLDEVVEEEARRMAALGVDLLVANIPYTSLLAAQRANIPAIALSCLNWADIYRHYFGDRPEGAAIEDEMLGAYESADVFLRTQPALPMSRLSNARAIGPIACRGTVDRQGLRRLLGVPEGERVGLITFGGIDSGLSFADWPELPGWKWVVTASVPERPDMVERERLAMGFTDIMASSDVVVTKPGYGTFTEAAVNGVPVLYAPRPDWPENPHLTNWLEAHGRCLAAATEQLFHAGSLESLLHSLFSLPSKPLTEPEGVAEGAEAIVEALARRHCLRM